MGRTAPELDLAALEQAIDALESQRPVLGDAVVDAAVRPLLQRRQVLLDGGEQRKLVTVVFADLVDSTVLARQLDPEDTREVINSYFAAWREAIEVEDGTVEKFIGDAVMAVFGLHRGREDDPARAVRAALAMRASLSELRDEVRARHSVDLEMRVGIDTGEVVVSLLGERGNADFVVVGDTVNRAARLQSSAPPGGIIISDETCNHVRGLFGLQRLEPLTLKGIDGPVAAYMVLSGEVQDFWPETRGIEGVTTRTVGRDLEMAQLQKLFDGVVENESGSVVTLLGEAGIGKSRLVHDFETWLAALPDGVWVLRGRATTATQETPHSLLRSAFAERLQIRGTDTPAEVDDKWRQGLARLLSDVDRSWEGGELVAAWLGLSPGDTPEVAAMRSHPEALQRRASHEVTELFRVMAVRAPVIVLFEDLHWADDGTLDWIQWLASEPMDFPLMLVATARTTLRERRPHWAVGIDAHTLIEIGSLSRRDSQALVSDILRHIAGPGEDLAPMVVRAAEGNPFFIEELVKWMIDQGVIVADGNVWSVTPGTALAGEMPTTLRGVLQARLDALVGGDRRVVERASVVGRVFWDEAVTTLAEADATGAGDDTEAYSRLREREVVFERPDSAFAGAREFSFRHALLRDVAYDGLLRARRRRYHALAARWLERVISASRRPDEHAAHLAHHLDEAGESASAAEWYMHAGQAAAAAFANDTALGLLARARHLAPPDLAFDVIASCEELLDRIGRRADQRELLDAMTAAAGDDPVRQARAHLAEGRWAFFHSQHALAEQHAWTAADLARSSGRQDLELDGKLLAGRALAFRTDHAAARRHLEGLLADARHAGSPRHEAEALRLLGVVATNLAEHEEAVRRLDQAVLVFRALSDADGEALTTAQKGAVFMSSERYPEARAALESGLAIFRMTGHRLRQGIILGNLTSIAIEEGRLADAHALGKETLDLTEALSDPEGIVSTLMRLGETLRLAGDFAGADDYFARSLVAAEPYELHYFSAFTYASLCVMRLTEGDLKGAREAASGAASAARRADSPQASARAVMVDGLVCLHSGDLGAAEGRLAGAATLHLDIDHASDALECSAARAVALFRLGQNTEARSEAVSAAEALLAGHPTGTLEPGRAIVHCHEVLSGLSDALAGTVAHLAGRYVAERAALIDEPDLRSSFLAAPVNAALALVAEAQSALVTNPSGAKRS